jgi:polyphosphate kinase
MPRNLDNRVELITPVEDPALGRELEDTLERCFADDTFAWDLQEDGGWTRRTGGTRSVHRELMERATARSDAAVESEAAGDRARDARAAGRPFVK